jgi:phosphopantetheine adenylyltransferase
VDPTERIAIIYGRELSTEDGHRALLHKASRNGRHHGGGDGDVIVGLVSTSLAEQTRIDSAHVELIEPFEERRENLETGLYRGDGRWFGPCQSIDGVVVQERVGETTVLAVAYDVRITTPRGERALTFVVPVVDG